ncbi:MAG: DUF559 domain-containing protein [Ilumatobacteraceae bacterium]
MTLTGRSLGANATGQRETTFRRFNAGDVSDATLRSRDQSGHRVSITQLHALTELMVDIGPPVRTFGPTSLSLSGYEGFRLAKPFQLVVPRGRNISRIGHVIHTSQTLDPIDCESAFGLDITSPTRAVIDLVRVASIDEVRAALLFLQRDGLSSQSFLHQRIAALRTRGRYGIPRLLDLIAEIEAESGDSWLEQRMLELIAAAGLPRPLCQQVLTRAGNRLVRVDFFFEGTNLVIEALGYRWHRSREQMQRDADRMNQLTLDGYRVLQFTYQAVTQTPALVTTQIRAGLDRDPFAPLILPASVSPHIPTKGFVVTQTGAGSFV